MATFNSFSSFVWALGKGFHDLQNHQYRIALSSAASAPVAGNSVLADLTTVVWAGLSSSQISITSFTNTPTRNASAIWAPLVLTGTSSTGGPTFRYISVFNFTNSTQRYPLVGWVDFGSNVLLNNGDTLTINWNQTSSVSIVAQS